MCELLSGAVVYGNRASLKGGSRKAKKTKTLPGDREIQTEEMEELIPTLLTHQSETELSFICLEDSDSITGD